VNLKIGLPGVPNISRCCRGVKSNYEQFVGKENYQLDVPVISFCGIFENLFFDGPGGILGRLIRSDTKKAARASQLPLRYTPSTAESFKYKLIPGFLGPLGVGCGFWPPPGTILGGGSLGGGFCWSFFCAEMASASPPTANTVKINCRKIFIAVIFLSWSNASGKSGKCVACLYCNINAKDRIKTL
jgi:hypothetical protein